jgi:hypothetical protein
MYTYERLREENETYAGTGGVSENNCSARFLPAFQDSLSGRVEQARKEDGSPAPMHLLCALPDEWVAERDASGRILALKDTIIAGFLRDGVFYTREEAASACRQH